MAFNDTSPCYIAYKVTKMSKNKLIKMIETEIPDLGLHRAKRLIMKVRKQNGDSLTGLKMIEIIEKVKQIVQDEASDSSLQELFNCDHCAKTFAHKASLKRHQMSHQEEKTTFKCNYCEKEFKRKDTKDKHMRINHKSHYVDVDALRQIGEDDYRCKMCGENFGKEVQEYENHIILRSCQKGLQDIKLNSKLRLKCNLCEKSYTQLFTLRRHKKEKHTNETLNSSKETKSEQKLKEDNALQVDKKTCPLCYRIFFNRQSRDRHIDKMHREPAIKPVSSSNSKTEKVSCDICEKSFLDIKELMQHMDWKHKDQK